jgi:GDPmannose 4,6-dehydratase
VAKTYGHFITQNYRESYGMFAASGILFNHESSRRGLEFVSRKITYGVAKIKLRQASKLRLGNLDARRDWGYAAEYVQAMHLMLQQSEPGDFVVGTGITHSVRDLADRAFAAVGLNWRDHVISDPGLNRPAEVDLLCADPRRAREVLGWSPAVPFEELVTLMVEADMRILSQSAGSGTDGPSAETDSGWGLEYSVD